jgi:Zn finger protein HypA/HybF involved in hydrogenase expression
MISAEDVRAWQEADDEDVMQQPWCCLSCSGQFRFGQIRMRAGGLHCPKCDSGQLHPAGGDVMDLARYDGEVGTLN